MSEMVGPEPRGFQQWVGPLAVLSGRGALAFSLITVVFRVLADNIWNAAPCAQSVWVHLPVLIWFLSFLGVLPVAPTSIS
jgi:hypothetical protein